MLKRIVAVIGVLMLASAAFAEDLKAVDTPNAIFETGYIQVVGESEAGQTQYKAKRAAKIVAQRNLLETVQGLHLIGASTVKDGMEVSDGIQTSVRGFLQGAVVVAEEYLPGGYGRVVLRLNLRGKNSLYTSLAPVLNQPPAGLDSQPKSEFKPVAAAAPAAPESPAVPAKSYDGLIVVVEGTDFKPALANRIITEGQDILFEPSKVAPQMLIERGCGGYTTTEDKAKALLASWGSKSPLVVKCVRVQRGTEAVVSVQDATIIFEQNKMSNMLPQAKVVFVL